MLQPASITAYFRDAAQRHPTILAPTDPDTPYAQRQFYELEWDEMMQNASALALPKWTVVLEDYVERQRDNGGDYVSIVLDIPFYVVKHVPQGDAAAKMTVWQEARELAYDIVGKMRDDEGVRGCEPDVPDGVITPEAVELNASNIVRVKAPFADNAYGVRAVCQWRIAEGVVVSRARVAWVPRS